MNKTVTTLILSVGLLVTTFLQGHRVGGNRLHNAIWDGDVNLIMKLLESKERVWMVDQFDSKGRTPLHCALEVVPCKDEHKQEKMSFIEMVLNSFPIFNLSLRDKRGKTPLSYAVCWGDLEFLKFLLKKAVPDFRDNQMLVGAAALRDSAILNFLLTDLECDPNVRDFVTGNTPLHIIVFHDFDQAVKLLLAAGANPFIKNNEGQTPKEVAFLGGIKKILEKEERKWTERMERMERETAFMLASQRVLLRELAQHICYLARKKSETQE